MMVPGSVLALTAPIGLARTVTLRSGGTYDWEKPQFFERHRIRRLHDVLDMSLRGIVDFKNVWNGFSDYGLLLLKVLFLLGSTRCRTFGAFVLRASGEA